VAADFPSLVSLACHDLRTPLATVQGFAKTLLRLEEVDGERTARYLGLIDAASDELVELLDLLSLAARIEAGKYDPVVREIDSLELAPVGATGVGAIVNVEPEAVGKALASLERAAVRHGGGAVSTSVVGPGVLFRPVTAEAAPVVLGDDQKDLGAAVAVRLIRAIGGDVTLDGDRLTVTLPA
jgi:signal transduction histidine kinase